MARIIWENFGWKLDLNCRSGEQLTPTTKTRRVADRKGEVVKKQKITEKSVLAVLHPHQWKTAREIWTELGHERLNSKVHVCLYFLEEKRLIECRNREISEEQRCERGGHDLPEYRLTNSGIRKKIEQGETGAYPDLIHEPA